MAGERFQPDRRAERQTPPSSNVSRRKILIGLGTVGAVVAGGLISESLDRGTKKQEQKPGQAPEKKSERDPLAIEANPKYYPSGELKGYRLNDLFTDYTGVKGLVGDTILVDFRERQIGLLKRKLEYIKRWEESEKKTAPWTKEVIAMGTQLCQEYQDKAPTKLSVTEYAGHIDDSLRTIRRGIDWVHLGRSMSSAKRPMTPAMLATIRLMETKLSRRHLLSYVLTELMPGVNGKLNARMLDFLLQNAGREFVESIFAVNDIEISGGPYQFTPHALGGGTKPVGASLIDRFVKPSQLPDSVAKLRGNDHHKAAHLFSIFNFQLLVRMLPRNKKIQDGLLKELEKFSGDELLEYVSTAHHAPKHAIGAFIKFLQARVSHPEKMRRFEILKAKNEKLPPKRRKKLTLPKAPDYEDFCRASKNKNLLNYLLKTRANNKELAARGF